MIPLALVTGFLGSGKTAFLKHLVRRQQGRKIVWLINEFSARDVDATWLGRETENVLSLTGGNLFCRCLFAEFSGQLRELPARFGSPGAPVEGVVVEASGLADPSAVGGMLAEARLDQVYRLSEVVAVVDPGSFLKLLQTLPNIRTQIEAANQVLVNKIDIHTPAMIEQAEAAVRALNPAAQIMRTSYGAADVDIFAACRASTPPSPLASCADPRFMVRNLILSGDVDLDELQAAIETVADDIYRVKGFVRHAGRCFHVDYSTSGWEVREMTGSEPSALVLIAREPCSEAVRRLLGTLDSGERVVDGTGRHVVTD